MNATSALGWALVHFLWQGAALALLLALGLALTRTAAAHTRYTLSLLTLGGMLILPLATGIGLYNRRDAAPAPTTTTSLAAPATDPSPSPSPSSAADADRGVTRQPLAGGDRVPGIRDLLTPALPWLVIAWVIGVVAFSVRLGHGWRSARRLRTTGTRRAAASLQQTLSRLAARMRVSRPVQLVESMLVEVPAVIGWMRPVILVPASALTGLTPQQLEVLLAHELAHVRRHDYVVNLVQCAIETLLFYHPAVWWVSRRVRDERENCCDDLVVELCGDRRLYAAALVEMERLRPPPPAVPRLALAASGGSLLNRVRRLVGAPPETAGRELFPRWSAGLAGVVAVSVALLAAGSDRLAGEPAQPQAIAADTTRTRPDTVVRHPDPSQPLGQRWDWARAQARQLGKRTYWIGYQIARPEWLEHSVYMDRGTEVIGENVRFTGRMYGDFQGFRFRGVRLAPLTGTTDSDDIGILLGFTSDQSGKAVLTHVHVASVYLPMDFRGRSLLWLGKATDAQSIPLIEGVFASTTYAELREDIVAAVGMHGSSDLVVPILIRWLTSREPTDVRTQAAEGLGFHPTTAAVVALSRAARSDAASDVRREAAEALGDNTLPAATDSTIAIARTATDPETRREAVEGLGEKTGERALAALTAIAQSDRDEDVQREAVETLGEMSGGRGMNAVRDIARTHPRPDIRREAVETLGENLPTAETVRMLSAVATGDRNEDVQREAVETLGEIGELGLPAVIDIARTHPSPEVRREAIETVAEHVPPAQALELLGQIARRDPDSDVQRAAVETLGELHDDRAYNLLVELARTHPVSDVRREAVETLGETGRTDSVIVILDGVARGADDPDVAREAVETLAELEDPRALGRVARIARQASGDIEVRRAAIEKYAEYAPADSAVALFQSILAADAPEDVYSEVLESLEELEGGAGIPALIDAARSHPNREVRADALRRLAESDDPRAQKVFDQTLRRP